MRTFGIIFDGKPGAGPEPETDPAPFGPENGAQRATEAPQREPRRTAQIPTVVSPEAKALADTVKRKPGRPRKTP